MIIRRILFLVCCFILLGGHLAAAFPGPTEALRPTLLGIIDIISDPALAGNAQKEPRRKKIMAIAAHGFNFTEMSKRVLGKTWTKIDNQQRDQFELLFTKLLENAYIGKLEGYAGEEITFTDERIKGHKAAVSTVIKNKGTAPFPVSYVMLENGKGWLVYDINIEGVSLVRNYREQFKSILRKDKFDGLVKVLEEKNDSFNVEDPK